MTILAAILLALTLAIAIFVDLRALRAIGLLAVRCVVSAAAIVKGAVGR
jgi:hypothetical protein